MIETSIRKAIITGGSSGIGKSIVHRFFEAGYKTVAGDINTSEDLPGHSFPVDLTQPVETDRFCTKVIKTIGAPDILICNAGRGIHEQLAEGDPDTWEQIFRLNVFSTMRLIRAFVPGMLKNGFGDVVFISSVSSSSSYTYGGVYSATKAAVDKLAETLRLEVQPTVRVTVIHPGVVDTNFFDNTINGTQTPESIGWGALKPEQIADAVFYAINQPHDISVNDIVIRPSAQSM